MSATFCDMFCTFRCRVYWLSSTLLVRRHPGGEIPCALHEADPLSDAIPCVVGQYVLLTADRQSRQSIGVAQCFYYRLGEGFGLGLLDENSMATISQDFRQTIARESENRRA